MKGDVITAIILSLPRVPPKFLRKFRIKLPCWSNSTPSLGNASD